MRQLELVELDLENFKGPSPSSDSSWTGNFTLTPEDENIKVVGENAAGKTALLDSYLWLIWGQDSRHQSQFDIKSVGNKDREASVTAEFKLDGETFTLGRSYGDDYNYSVNNVPEKKSEYDAFLEEKFDLEKLQILSTPRYFNEIHWKDKREKLMNLVDGVTTEDIIESNSELEELDLQGLDPEDRRDQLNSEIDELEEEKEDIPVQIQTLQENAPEMEVDPDDWEEFVEKLEAEKEGLVDLRGNLEDEITDLKSSGQEAELRKEKSQIEASIDEFEQNWKSEYDGKLEAMRGQKKDFQESFDQVKREIKKKEREKEKAKERIEEQSTRRKQLRDRWHKIREEKFDGEVCPVCDQEIPEDRLEEVRQEINVDKAQKIESIQSQGDKKKDKQKELEGKVDQLGEELEDLGKEKNDLKGEIDKTDERIAKLKNKKDTFAAQDRYRELVEDKERVVEKLESEKESPPEKLKEKREQLKGVKEEIDEQNEALAKVKEYQRSLGKVGKLKAKESELSGKLEQKKNQLRLVNEFVRTKANMLEDSINAKFDLVDFKLFEEYKSKSGVKETCQIMVDGVSWSTLNNGAMVQGGLDIINTLSREWELKAPVFVDNAESITDIPEGGSHQVQLVVREGVNELEVV